MDSNSKPLESLLTVIRDVVSIKHHQEHDVALPVFNPSTSDNGAATWCDHIEKLGNEFNWSSITQVAKAGKALRGSALLWFETWEPEEGRTWDNFRSEIVALYPENKNLSEKLHRAVMYSSDNADTYCEYAREKVRLLKATKISFTEIQLVELICGSIRDNNVRMASFNSSAKTVSELISLFTSYVKTKKRSFDIMSISTSGLNENKRHKLDFTETTLDFTETTSAESKYCYNCKRPGHLKAECYFNQTLIDLDSPEYETLIRQNMQTCTFCHKNGHRESACFRKKRLLNAENQNENIN